jgi:hypothetical protein
VLVPVLFAFALHCFLYYSFASIIVISYVHYSLNFLVYFLLYIEDHVEVGAIKVGIVIGT